MVVMSVRVLIWERDSGVPNFIMEEGEVGWESGDWDGGGESDVIGCG